MYAYKEKYTLDFSTITHWHEIHQIIKKELDFPHNYGENWDDFWDCLTDRVDIDEPLNIEILGAEVLEQRFPEDLKMLVETLKELKHWEDDYFCNCVKVEIVFGDARYEIS